MAMYKLYVCPSYISSLTSFFGEKGSLRLSSLTVAVRNAVNPRARSPNDCTGFTGTAAVVGSRVAGAPSITGPDTECASSYLSFKR